MKKKHNNQTEFKKLEEPDRKGLVLSDYISAIAEIPDSVLRLHGLLLEPLNSDPQGALILGCREAAIIKVRWLEYFLLNKVEHLSELSLPMVALGKSEAEVSVANLRLVQEVYKRGDPNYLTFISPTHWWFLCEWDYYKSAMQHNGLIGDPLLIGKRKLTNQVSDWLKELEDPRRWIQNGEDLADDAVVSPLTALVMVASSIAAEDRHFCITYWRDYLRVMKRSNRTFRNDSKRPIAYLAADGTFQVFERGKGKKS